MFERMQDYETGFKVIDPEPLNVEDVGFVQDPDSAPENEPNNLYPIPGTNIGSPSDGMLIKGTDGNDWIIGVGGGGVDTILGLDGDDWLEGGPNTDYIGGDDGIDTIYGFSGDDVLSGGSGNDILDGGLGNDSLTGGSGKDVFRFTNFTPGEVDIITDFESGDRIQISAQAFGAQDFGGSLVAGTAGTTGYYPNANPLFIPETHGVWAWREDFDPMEGINAWNVEKGVSTFYYDRFGGGLYFDLDSGSTNAAYTLFAQLQPAPDPMGLNRPTVGTIEIIF
jgi:Ca2+-binding RTX toxin-like protein